MSWFSIIKFIIDDSNEALVVNKKQLIISLKATVNLMKQGRSRVADRPRDSPIPSIFLSFTRKDTKQIRASLQYRETDNPEEITLVGYHAETPAARPLMEINAASNLKDFLEVTKTKLEADPQPLEPKEKKEIMTPKGESFMEQRLSFEAANPGYTLDSHTRAPRPLNQEEKDRAFKEEVLAANIHLGGKVTPKKKKQKKTKKVQAEVQRGKKVGREWGDWKETLSTVKVNPKPEPFSTGEYGKPHLIEWFLGVKWDFSKVGERNFGKPQGYLKAERELNEWATRPDFPVPNSIRGDKDDFVLNEDELEQIRLWVDENKLGNRITGGSEKARQLLRESGK